MIPTGRAHQTFSRRFRKPLLYPLSYEATYSKRPPNDHFGSNLTANCVGELFGSWRSGVQFRPAPASRRVPDLDRSAPLQRHNLEEGLQQCLFLRALAYYAVGQHSHAISDLDRLAGVNPGFPNLNEVRNEMLTGKFTLDPIAKDVSPRT